MRLASRLGWFSIGVGLGAGIGIVSRQFRQASEPENPWNGRNQPPGKTGTGEVKQTLIVNRPPDEVYRFWRDFEKLPSFMRNLESVQVTGDRTSHWKAKGPAGSTFEWVRR